MNSRQLFISSVESLSTSCLNLLKDYWIGLGVCDSGISRDAIVNLRVNLEKIVFSKSKFGTAKDFYLLEKLPKIFVFVLIRSGPGSPVGFGT